MRFCFRLGWLAAAAVGAIYAGSPSQTSGVTSVVRTDRSGKLVRRIVGPAVAAQKTAPSADITAAVDRVAAGHLLPPELIHSVIQVESNYNPYAVSPKGAMGLMQLIPATARRFGVNDAFDPMENIEGGAKYLKHLLDLYHGNYPLALAAYNAGEEAVARYGGVPPYPETQNYVVAVSKRFESSKAAAKPADAEVKRDSVDPEGPGHIQEIVEPDGSVRYVSR